MKAIILWMSVMGIMVWSGLVREASAGELTVDGSMVVKTNLVVSGEATIQKAVIQHLPPQGDLGMGPYTNGVAH